MSPRSACAFQAPRASRATPLAELLPGQLPVRGVRRRQRNLGTSICLAGFTISMASLHLPPPRLDCSLPYVGSRVRRVLSFVDGPLAAGCAERIAPPTNEPPTETGIGREAFPAGADQPRRWSAALFRTLSGQSVSDVAQPTRCDGDGALPSPLTSASRGNPRSSTVLVACRRLRQTVAWFGAPPRG